MKLDNLRELFVSELKDLHSAETQLVKALPNMVKGAHSDELKACFRDHLEETKLHVDRLEKVIASLDESSRGPTCDGMQGLIKEGGQRLKVRGDGAVIDAGIIAAAQRVEHYEIAGYGCARTFAELLGMADAAQLLDQSLEEEKAADERLNTIAMNLVNPEAARV